MKQDKVINAIPHTVLALLYLGLLLLSGLLLTGCASTQSTVTEFDESGRIIKKTETSESVIQTVTKSTQGKTVVMWEDGWAGYISVSSGTTDDPTPHGKIFAGKVNKGAVSILPTQTNLLGIAKIIQATKSNLSVGMDGMTSESADTGASNKNMVSSNTTGKKE